MALGGTGHNGRGTLAKVHVENHSGCGQAAPLSPDAGGHGTKAAVAKQGLRMCGKGGIPSYPWALAVGLVGHSCLGLVLQGILVRACSDRIPVRFGAAQGQVLMMTQGWRWGGYEYWED